MRYETVRRRQSRDTLEGTEVSSEALRIRGSKTRHSARVDSATAELETTGEKKKRKNVKKINEEMSQNNDEDNERQLMSGEEKTGIVSTEKEVNKTC